MNGQIALTRKGRRLYRWTHAQGDQKTRQAGSSGDGRPGAGRQSPRARTRRGRRKAGVERRVEGGARPGQEEAKQGPSTEAAECTDRERETAAAAAAQVEREAGRQKPAECRETGARSARRRTVADHLQVAETGRVEGKAVHPGADGGPGREAGRWLREGPKSGQSWTDAARVGHEVQFGAWAWGAQAQVPLSKGWFRECRRISSIL